MARTRSDSGLSSGRLGVTSQLGHLATSTPLVAPLGLEDDGTSTPARRGVPPALQAALRESAKVRRRLADELAREAGGG